MPIRSRVFLIGLLIIVIAAATIAEFSKMIPEKRAVHDPTVILWPTPLREPVATPTLKPTPTPVPLPYDGIGIGFAAARFSTAPPFPGPEYWSKAGKMASGKFEGSTPEGIWVIGGILQGGTCYLNFPSSQEYSHISFTATDENEEYLDYFDRHGISIILQVEPGIAEVDTVLKLVLDQYSHHPCVAGIGVDVEWYGAPMYWSGKPVTDEEAAHWYELINTYDGSDTADADTTHRMNDNNKKYCLALTHWKAEKMPPTYRKGVYFLYDGERFSSLDDMMTYCIAWGKTFKDSPVGYYIGFPNDNFWWGDYDDPFKTLGDSLLKNIDNAKGVYWVGLSIKQIYPG